MGAIIFNGIFYKIVDCTIKKYIAAGDIANIVIKCRCIRRVDISMPILTGAVIKMN